MSINRNSQEEVIRIFFVLTLTIKITDLFRHRWHPFIIFSVTSGRIAELHLGNANRSYISWYGFTQDNIL